MAYRLRHRRRRRRTSRTQAALRELIAAVRAVGSTDDALAAVEHLVRECRVRLERGPTAKRSARA